MLRDLPLCQDVVFEPLEMAQPFSSGARIPPETDLSSAYSLFSVFITEESIALLSVNTNKYARSPPAVLGALKCNLYR